MSATIEDSVVGRVVGPYRVLERIGTEGASALYVAEHVHLDRKVAMRLLASDGAGGSSGPDRFLADARKLSRIRHDNVLGLQDVGQAGDGHVYLALDLPEGKSLDQVIAQHGPIAGARARIIGRQIGAVLVAAARESVLNRDVAPAEIFLSTKDGHGDVVRIDLGTADLLASDSGAAVDSVRMLGGLLYLMVVGRPPVAAENGAPPDPMAARPDLEIPADLEVLIMRALDPDPTKRWPDIDAMLRMLTAAEQRASGPSATVEQVDAHASPEAGAGTGVEILGHRLFARPSPQALIAGGAAAVAALILGIAVGGARRDPPAREAAVASSQPPGAVGPAGRDQPGGVISAPAPASAPAPVPALAAGLPVVTPDAIALPGAPFPAAAPAAPASAGTTAAMSAAGAATRPPGALAARATGEGGAPRRDAGPLSETRRGATAQGGGGVAGAPSRDDEGKAAVAGRASSGDDACAVTLGSRPWSEVWIDGRQAGFTPLIDYPIDCGSHDVVFKSSESDIEKRVPIVVAPGQVFKKIVDLTGGRPTGPAPAGAQKAGNMELAAAATTPGSAPAAAAGSGCLVTLGSRPWSEIWIDGKHVGVTPLVEYALPCGKHEVIFRSTDPEAERRETIVLQSGRTLKKVVTLVEGTAP